MKIGLMLPLFSGDAGKVAAAARDAETLGYDGVFGFDHFFPPGAASERPSLEVYTSLAAAGASTERISVGTLVTRAVLRPAGMIAKLAATIDFITGGRMILGMGTGDPINRGEHDAFGFPNPDSKARREQLAETVAAVRALFRGDAYEGGKHVPAIGGPLLPRPVREGGPPVWVGGVSEEMVRIAGALADGWNGWGIAVESFRKKAEVLKEAAGSLGRQVQATWAGVVVVGSDEEEARAMSAERKERGVMGDAFSGSPERCAEFLTELSNAGAAWVVLMLAGEADRRSLVAQHVLPALRLG